MALHFDFFTAMYVTVVYLHVSFVHKIINIKGFTKIKYSEIFLNGILLDYIAYIDYIDCKLVVVRNKKEQKKQLVLCNNIEIQPNLVEL